MVSLPLALAVKIVDPLMPLLRGINLISRRLIWPSFEPEPFIEVADLERAIEHSGNSESLIYQEQAVLQNIVQLSNIRIEEWMRPRTQFQAYHPPVSLADLNGSLPASGYLLVTEPDSQEIEKAIRLDNRFHLPNENLERFAEPVLYLPWCATVANALEKMSHRDREVTVVVNEHGESIGIITIEDILETVFVYSPSRTRRLLDLPPLEEIGAGRWRVAGMISLRQLSRRLGIDIPPTSSVTVAGVIQESIQRLAEAGDQCQWGPFRFLVIEASQRGTMLVEVTLVRGCWSDTMTLSIILLVLGIFLSAFFSGNETGFYRASRVRVVMAGLDGDRVSRWLLKLINNPTWFVATTLIGNNVANYLTSLSIVLLASTVSTSSAAEMLLPIMMSPLLFVYGELLPKSLFYQAPNFLLRFCAPLFLIFTVVFAPAAAILWAMSQLLERFIGQSPEKIRLALARKELQQVLEEGLEAGILQPTQRQLAQSFFLVASKPVSDFCTPLNRVRAASIASSIGSVLKLARKKQLTDILVFQGNRQTIGRLRKDR